MPETKNFNHLLSCCKPSPCVELGHRWSWVATATFPPLMASPRHYARLQTSSCCILQCLQPKLSSRDAFSLWFFFPFFKKLLWLLAVGSAVLRPADCPVCESAREGGKLNLSHHHLCNIQCFGKPAFVVLLFSGLIKSLLCISIRPICRAHVNNWRSQRSNKSPLSFPLCPIRMVLWLNFGLLLFSPFASKGCEALSNSRIHQNNISLHWSAVKTRNLMNELDEL